MPITLVSPARAAISPPGAFLYDGPGSRAVTGWITNRHAAIGQAAGRCAARPIRTDAALLQKAQVVTTLAHSRGSTASGHSSVDRGVRPRCATDLPRRLLAQDFGRLFFDP